MKKTQVYLFIFDVGMPVESITNLVLAKTKVNSDCYMNEFGNEMFI